MTFLPKRSIALVALAFAPALAFATDGYFQHGYGVKAQGLGGAGIAFAQDGLAAATNPAGTAFVEDRIDGGLTWFAPKRGAEITSPNPTAGTYDGNGKKDFFLPEFGYVKHLSPETTVGVAAYGNGGMNTTYNSGVPLFNGGTGGKTGINLEQFFISPSIAWKPNEQNSIGLAANIAYQRFKAEGLQGFGVQNAGTDTSHGVGLRLGWTGTITPNLTLGATWSSKINATKFKKYSGLFADGGGFDIPENYGLGIAYKLTPTLTVAGDIEEIKYSDVKSVGNPLANFFTSGLGTANGAGFGWKDITVYKLGVSYEYTKNLTLRGGINHADQPILASQTLFNVLAPGVVQDHLSLGLTWKTANKQELSVAYTHAFKKTIKGSGSIPAAFGGGEANVHLDENILGVSYAWLL
ncbi:MAG TPA: outer membrane protein transport protein [Rhodocyclaceae bacterium]|nr:outer membrane protein transport protein [Rhodocyclaceae bacterium]